MEPPTSSSSSSSHKAPLLGEAPSGTSFYTNVTQQDSYPTLSTILHRTDATTTTTTASTNPVHQVLYDVLYSIEQITDVLRTTLVYVSGTHNDFGDVQLSVDLQADALLWTMAMESSVIHYAASEEAPTLQNMKMSTTSTHKKEENGFIVCWDPLDGSSIVDNNWAVGTIVGVWPSTFSSSPEKEEDWTNGTVTGRHQATALVAMYGPRTTVLVALEDGTYEFTYICSSNSNSSSSSNSSPAGTVHHQDDDDDDEIRKQRRMAHTGQHWMMTRSTLQIAAVTTPQCRIFAPANVRVTTELSWYHRIVQYYMQQRYTLRYTGGLVPDLYQQFTKGMGIYMNPVSSQSPPKLRLTFEVAPMALLIEKAGGTTSDCRTSHTSHSVLDIPITSMDQRTAFCCGTTSEVQRFHTMMMEGLNE